jgi:hypothetical protein
MSFFESFESGDLSAHPWTSPGGATWTVNMGTAPDGEHVAMTGLLEGGGASEIAITLTFPAPGQVTFWHRESSEFCCDKLRFYVDDEDLGQWSGLTEWSDTSVDIPAGVHELRWRYEKDEDTDVGEDAVMIDLIEADGYVP